MRLPLPAPVVAVRPSLILVLLALGCTAESDDPSEVPDTADTAVEPCGDDEYAVDDGCVPLTECSEDEYESTPATATSDRVCDPLTECTDDEYESAPPTATSDRVCSEITECMDMQYESAPPTATSDRECTDFPLCEPGEALQIDEAFPADSACEPCQLWESCPGGYEPAEACTWPSAHRGDAGLPCPVPVEVAAGAFHSCAVDDTGHVLCWGSNEWGQLEVPEGLGEVTHLAADALGFFTCALDTDGEIACWGEYLSGLPLTPPPSLTGVTRLTTGSDHACALHDGGVTCWGGAGSEPQTAVPAGLGAVEQVSAGSAHTCALHDAGSGDAVTCWGSGAASVVPSSLSDVEQVRAFANTTCAVHTDGRVTCWGDLDVPGSDDPEDPDNPHLGKAWVDVAGGLRHICAVDTAGTVSCFGLGGSHFRAQDTPSDVTGIVQLDGGFEHMCATLDTDEVLCWGLSDEDNHTWNMGEGQDHVPVNVGPVRSVSTGEDHACALTTAGTVLCWGNNNRNKASPPEYVNSGEMDCKAGREECFPTTPWLPMDTTIVDLAVGYQSTCVMLASGHTSCWGYQLQLRTKHGTFVHLGSSLGREVLASSAQPSLYTPCFQFDGVGQNEDLDEVICDGGPTELEEPFALGGDAVQRACGMDTLGDLVCMDDPHEWGSPADPAPDSVNDGPEVVSVAVGAEHMCSADELGDVTCWGEGPDGQTTPPEGLSDVVEVHAGMDHTCALDVRGDVACWGANDEGQLDLPPGLDDIVQLQAGHDFTCAVDSVGALFCWGANTHGQTTVWQ